MTKERDTFMVAAQSSRERLRKAENGATGEMTGDESEIRSLGGGCAPDSVAQNALRALIKVSVWKVVS